jgi:dolichyl-phosphate beta-glucosyltransferase
MPSDTPFLSLVIPAHNEESRLPGTLEQVFAFLEKQAYSAEVIVVENGSTDRTLDIAQDFAGCHPGLRVIHTDERGKGLAVNRGMLAAHGTYRFFADADFSMPVSEINRFLPPALPDFDIAIASRETAGAVRYGEPFRRHLSGRVFNALIQLVVLPGLEDTQCGFKCFRAPVVEDIFSRQTMPGWSFDVELLYIARRKGYRVQEIGIPWYFNPETKVSLVRDSLRMAADLFTIRRNARQGKYD